jgi:hypothetical protein
MKQSKFIKHLIIDEVNKLNEACGGGCGGGPEPMGITIASHDPGSLASYELQDESEELLSKEEALEMVSRIAAITSCPVTQSALMGTVEDLSDGEDEYSNQQDEFSFTGDVGELPGDEAFAIGLGAGKRGLDEPRG